MANVLVVNIGSTSLKYRLLDMQTETTRARGGMERVGETDSPCFAQAGEQRITHTLDTREGHAPAIKAMLDTLVRREGNALGVLDSLNDITGIGFKAVHAGMLRDAVCVDEDVLARMEAFAPVMPAHNPPYINAMRHFAALVPHIPLVAAFETAFHKNMPEAAAVYGIPYAWTRDFAVRRYGFHGASHRYVSERAAQIVKRPLNSLKIITCHLGGSSSLAAVKGGVSVDTSMGFTTQSGVPMAKRSADIDPFILPYLIEKTGKSLEFVLQTLVKNGGLAGISGLSGDMRDLEAARKTNPQAQLALDHFVHEVKKYIGAYAAIMNGVDVITFAGGIGENAVDVRARVCADLDVLGVQLDPQRNKIMNQEGIISTDASRVRLLVVPTNEEVIVARETLRVLTNKRK